MVRSNRFWIGERRDAQREAAAGGMAEQRQRCAGRGLADGRDKISEIVLELAEIGDIAARPRRAVAANVGREGLHASRSERIGQRMNAGA